MRTPRALTALGTGVLTGLLLAGCGGTGDYAESATDSAMMAEGAMPAEAPMMDQAAMTEDRTVTDRSIIRMAT